MSVGRVASTVVIMRVKIVTEAREVRSGKDNHGVSEGYQVTFE